MTSPAPEELFAVEYPQPVDAVEEPAPKMTERQMLDLLVRRYTKIAMNAHRYAFAEHVPDRPGYASRIADFIAVDCYGFGGSGSARQHAIHGHEVKVSRSDWLAELRDPSKAEPFFPYTHYWWLVVSDTSIVRDGELPPGWGLMARSGAVLRAVKRPPRRAALPLPAQLNASLLRAVAKTARRVTP